AWQLGASVIVRSSWKGPKARRFLPLQGDRKPPSEEVPHAQECGAVLNYQIPTHQQPGHNPRWRTVVIVCGSSAGHIVLPTSHEKCPTERRNHPMPTAEKPDF